MKKTTTHKLRVVKPKSRSKIRQNIVESAVSIADHFEGDIHAYAIVALRNNGNVWSATYDCRKDFPIVLIPELTKQALVQRISTNSTKNEICYDYEDDNEEE